MTRRSDDIDRELRFHVEMRARELEAAGLPAGRARREAERMFGRRHRIEAACRRAWRPARRETMNQLTHDVRDAVRGFIRQPSLSLLMLLTLSLGFGATTAMFTVVDAVVLRPLAYPASDRLVWLESTVRGMPRPWDLSVAGYFHFAHNNETLQSLGAYTTSKANLVDGGAAERVDFGRVSASLFAVLQVEPALGRLFTAAEDVPNGPSVAMVSHALWQRRYGGDAAIVGRIIDVSGVATEVVGVLPPDFELPVGEASVLKPLGLNPDARAVNSHFLSGIGRMRDGTSIEAVQADIRRLDGQLTARFPNAYSASFMESFATTVMPLRDRVIGSMSRTLWMILAAVSLVLLIACANVANIYLIRTEARRREIALRAALGASARRIASHYIIEGLVLTLTAAAVGLALAALTVELVVAFEPANLPRLREIALGWPSAAFIGVLTTVAGILFGLFPLAHVRGGLTVLREGGRGMTTSRSRTAVRRMLVASEVALAVVLLAAAALLARSVVQLGRVEPGFVDRAVLTFDISLPFSTYRTHDAVNRFYRDLTSRIEAIPGVARAAATTDLPLASWSGCASTWVSGAVADHQNGRCVGVVNATPGFAEALGLRVTGRAPNWAANDTRRGTALITRALADAYWPGENPIGRKVSSYSTGPPFYEIVGVVEGLRAEGLDRPEVEAIIYPALPIEPRNTWIPPRTVSIVVGTRTDNPLSIVAPVRRAVAELDAQVPIAGIMTMEQVVARSMSRVSFATTLIGIAAGLALVLSVIGVYGVLSYLVDQRRNEIGIRLALGASTARVRGMVMRQSLWLIALGLIMGIAGAVASTRLLASLLFEITATDTVTIASAAAAIGTVALCASWLPARRACRIDPAAALRN